MGYYNTGKLNASAGKMKLFVHVQRSTAMSDFIKNLTYPSYPYLLTSACAAATAPAMPPRIPGIPCKLCTPHVSWVLVYFVKNGYRRDARRCEVKFTTPKSKSMLRFLFSILRHDMNYQYLLSGMRIPQCSVLRQSSQSKEPPTD